MPKIVKGVEGRRPPAPTADHQVISAWIAEVMPKVHPLVTGVDELICSTIPGLEYAVKWSKAHYLLEDHGWIIEVSAYHKSVNVLFFGGADFASPPPLGDVGRSRYVKLHDPAEVAAPELRAWVEHAATVPGWR